MDVGEDAGKIAELLRQFPQNSGETAFNPDFPAGHEILPRHIPLELVVRLTRQ
jgi:hypothetical protein